MPGGSAGRTAIRENHFFGMHVAPAANVARTPPLVRSVVVVVVVVGMGWRDGEGRGE